MSGTPATQANRGQQLPPEEYQQRMTMFRKTVDAVSAAWPGDPNPFGVAPPALLENWRRADDYLEAQWEEDNFVDALKAWWTVHLALIENARAATAKAG